ncbi:DUF4416 family protein [Planctomycetes bacterium K23_9]|uniref:GTP-binding protein n=1 Tax=Stieleria marina TaxID=1930275 RepID=A0A517NTY9_9BACT|nr:hypothetical protein K239x_25410 [Planctomycetes bacterium K23_9]
MAAIEYIEPVVRMCAVISRHPAAIAWGVEKLTGEWGEVAHQSEPLPFVANGYYDEQMGPELKKVLVAFADLQEPGGLADWKHQTIGWEKEYASTAKEPEKRPLNLDSGYVTQAKLVLATTKDRDHRLYLRDGMFAEVTLNYVAKKWIHHRWTYPDYRTDKVSQFVQRCREQVRQHVQESGRFRQRVQRNEGLSD